MTASGIADSPAPIAGGGAVIRAPTPAAAAHAVAKQASTVNTVV